MSRADQDFVSTTFDYHIQLKTIILFRVYRVGSNELHMKFFHLCATFISPVSPGQDCIAPEFPYYSEDRNSVQ